MVNNSAESYKVADSVLRGSGWLLFLLIGERICGGDVLCCGRGGFWSWGWVVVVVGKGNLSGRGVLVGYQEGGFHKSMFVFGGGGGSRSRA